jgi:hypothetical protein
MVFCIGRLWESSEPQRFEWVLALYYFGNTDCRFITRTCGAATRFTRNESRSNQTSLPVDITPVAKKELEDLLDSGRPLSSAESILKRRVFDREFERLVLRGNLKSQAL